ENSTRRINEMTESISIECQVVQNPQNIASDMDGEKVMLNIANGKYYNLGSVGGRIWDMVATPLTINQLVTQLLNEYDVDKKECKIQVISFLKLLSAEG